MPQGAIEGFGGEKAAVHLAVGAVRGFRAWYVPDVDDPKLKSMSWSYYWTPGENTSECRAKGKVSNASKCKAELHPHQFQHLDECPRHDGCPYPRRNCACGFYGFTSESYWLDGSTPSASAAWYLGSSGGFTPVIHGVIESYGRMVVAEKGYRAQKAVIVGLALPLKLDETWLEKHDLTPQEASDRIVRGIRVRYPDVRIYQGVRGMLADLPVTSPKAP